MLILRRRAGEAIRIGEDIQIVVLEASAHRVKLGVEAPANVSVLREEVVLTQEENTRAAQQSVTATDLQKLAKNFSRGAESRR